MEKGTLFHLRNVINRRNVTKRCKEDLNAHEDFLLLVIRSHIIASTLKLLGMSSVASEPSPSMLSPETWMLNAADRSSKVMDIASQVIDKHVDFSMEFRPADAPDRSVNKDDTDCVHSYACEVMNLGLLYMEFCDAVKEGDGDRVIREWKYLLLLYRASKRQNYAIEAFSLPSTTVGRASNTLVVKVRQHSWDARS